MIGVEQTVQVGRTSTTDPITGKFSIFDSRDNSTPPPLRDGKRHIIPRSPFRILESLSDIAKEQTYIACSSGLPFSCRPWTRLGWTEVLLGAQYRTYSDAQLTGTGAENPFSIRRRRDLLRLHPEIEVSADQYLLESRENTGPVPTVEDQSPQFQYRLFYSNEPSISKSGGDWSFLGARANADGSLRKLPAFIQLRYDPNWTPNTVRYSQTDYSNALRACGTQDAPNYDACQSNLGAKGDATLSLSGVDYFGLVHRFVGPTLASALSQGAPADRAETGVCSAETPSVTASCWKGVDDTILLEAAIPPRPGDSPSSPAYSVSALLGFERPPLVEFHFELVTYRKLVCADGSSPASPCAVAQLSQPTQVSEFAFPNRPNPPDESRTVPVYAPVQSSGSNTISANTGFSYFNTSFSNTTKHTSRLFQDVNGDGYADTVSDGVVELTSPVGLTRQDWWRYFRATDNTPNLSDELSADGYTQQSTSISAGAGIGLTPPTGALPHPKGVKSTGTNSPDANVDPSFGLDIELGFDLAFVDLRDLNGDGIADVIAGHPITRSSVDLRNVSGWFDGLQVTFNNGNSLRTTSTPGMFQVAGQSASGFFFNTNHSAGFGVRLGMSMDAGSFEAGMGLDHRDTSSEGALVDFTGHGRPDLVLPTDSGIKIYPNLGNGFGDAKTFALPNFQLSSRVGAESGTQMTETTLVDAGTAFTTGVSTYWAKIVFTPGVKWARNQTRELIKIRDVNGDGAPDVVIISGDFLPLDGALTLDPSTLRTKIYYNPEAKYHLLAGITNPSGSRIDLHHSLYGNTGPENGRAVWALTGVARDDGFVPTPSMTAHGDSVRLASYDYAGGYFNRAEKQFYGFSHRSTKYFGCDSVMKATCINHIRTASDLDGQSLFSAGYRELQTVEAGFSNQDFLTQGIELSRVVSGVDQRTPSGANPPQQAVSHQLSAYSIDNLSTLTNGGTGQCLAPQSGSGDSWSDVDFAIAASSLSPLSDGSSFQGNGRMFGSGSICGIAVGACMQTLAQQMCNVGFFREQSAFWAQQTGSVRQRFVTLETFGNATVEAAASLTTPRLRSAIAFDHDQWGQVIGFDSIGEASSSWSPAPESSSNASIIYSPRQSLSALPWRPSGAGPWRPGSAPGATGYPMLGLAQQIEIFPKPWIDNPESMPAPLRVREAIFSDDGRGNLSDICLYPGGAGFQFTNEMCGQFRDNMRGALQDGYSTMEAALRAAYDKTTGLPKGVSEFNAIIHHQIADYDEFGNITHTISPLSRNKEWIERYLFYKDDPFRRTATGTALVRCVDNVPGAGIDSTIIPANVDCTYALSKLPAPVLRRAITHYSENRIDGHFGVVAETTDINRNNVLFDFDRWGRLGLVARSWGNAPRENLTFQERLKRAVAKVDGLAGSFPSISAANEAINRLPEVKSWRLLALADYARLPGGGDQAPAKNYLRSNLRRFEASDSYSGLLGKDNTTRETAAFSDGFGRSIQSLREADVCLGVNDALIDGGTNMPPTASLAERCKSTATGVATPAGKIDGLSRSLETFESFATPSNQARKGSEILFTDLLSTPVAKRNPVTTTTYDGASRPELVESRLSSPAYPGAVVGTTQNRYRIVPEIGDRLARFEALTLSPRCTASASSSDARGLKRTIFEDQEHFYRVVGAPMPANPPQNGAPYSRDVDATRGYCMPISGAAFNWAPDDQATDAQPSRVSYAYDALQQLSLVDLPLDASARATITTHYDLLGRMIELHHPDSGCTKYDYDGLSLLISETGSKFERERDTPCGSSSKVHNEKIYGYSGGRLLSIAYRSLEEQGGPVDQRDAVRIYYDRYPHAVIFGEVLETRRLVPNDQANQRFIDVTGRKCDNCIGQTTMISDRAGVRSFSFDELGLPRREVRSIVAPLRNVKPSEGHSETFLPEVAFYEQENSYTAFGDPVEERFSESAPMNPSNACISAGVGSCLARFAIGRKYAPDGSMAQQLFNGKPLINASRDELGRPAVSWTSIGIATGYRYDPRDLRLNQMATLTGSNMPVQVDGYQYDGGGNILSYANKATNGQSYESDYTFTYDAATRVTRFEANVNSRGRTLHSTGEDSYDSGYRFVNRSMFIGGNPGTNFQRKWAYAYSNDPTLGPVHAPMSIDFAIGEGAARAAMLAYDNLGRMTRIGSSGGDSAKASVLLSNRAMTWDSEGRLVRVRGVKDAAIPANDYLLREEYLYDSGGNRTLKMDQRADPQETAIIYMTPFYARPYDKRGAVQLSTSSLPIASLTPPANASENAVVSFLYSDLAIGSMTASVTGFGEPGDANATVIARREYSPFGLELTNNSLALTGRDDVPPLFGFHGKELNSATAFSSFGARYYSRDLGIWLKPDPNSKSSMFDRTGNKLGVYNFAQNNPTNIADLDGREATLASGAPDTSVYRRIEYMAPYIIDAASRHKNVGAIDMAAIVYQEKQQGFWADIKDLAGVASLPLRLNSTLPVTNSLLGLPGVRSAVEALGISPRQTLWQKASFGPAEMQLELASDLSGLSLKDPDQLQALWNAVNHVPSAMELLARNIEKNQEKLLQSLSPQAAGTAHNRGWEGFRKTAGAPSRVSSRITADVLRNLDMILQYEKSRTNVDQP